MSDPIETTEPAPPTTRPFAEEDPMTTQAIGEEGPTAPSAEEEVQSDGVSVTDPFGAF